MKFILQRGEDRRFSNGYPAKSIDKLPDDIPQLAEGDWVYSDILKGFVGYDLPGPRNHELYQQRLKGKSCETSSLPAASSASPQPKV